MEEHKRGGYQAYFVATSKTKEVAELPTPPMPSLGMTLLETQSNCVFVLPRTLLVAHGSSSFHGLNALFIPPASYSPAL